MDELEQMLHHNRASVKARGHDWDVADVMAVIENWYDIQDD